MKNIIITIAILLSINTVYGQFTVDSDGKVGINNSNPQQDLDLTGTMRFDGWTDVHFDWTHGECCGQPALYPESNWYFRLGTPTKKLGDIFATNIFCTSVTESSDENIKENITPLHSPLSKIMQINGVRFNLKSDYFKGLPEEIITKYSNKLQIGFLAQNIEEFYPEIVVTDKETGMKAISYTRMIPVLLEAIKEQQLQIENLTNTVNQMINKTNSDEVNNNKSAQVNKQNETNNTSKLMQNTPNPFTKSTIINYSISANSNAAKIIIFNMQGTLIKTYDKLRNAEQLIIKKAELSPGMYMYSLIVDGKEIDTKKMILTD